jgi:hypothetical protein
MPVLVKVIATVRFRGVTKSSLDNTTHPTRIAILDGIKRNALRVQGAQSVTVTIVSVKLAADGAVDIEFEVKAGGLTTDALIASTADYLDDTGPSGLAADTALGGTAVTTTVVNAPAAPTTSTGPSEAADVATGAIALVVIIIGAIVAALCVVAILAATTGIFIKHRVMAKPDSRVFERELVKIKAVPRGAKGRAIVNPTLDDLKQCSFFEQGSSHKANLANLRENARDGLRRGNRNALPRFKVRKNAPHERARDIDARSRAPAGVDRADWTSWHR